MFPSPAGPLKDRGALRLAMRAALFLYFVAVTCPLQFFYFEDHLDLSWVLAINVAAEQSMKFGENFFWTYGPFAYLGSPLPVGNNLHEALLAQSALWAAAAAIGFDLFFVQRLPLGGLLALSLSTAVAWPLFHFNYGGAENLIAFLAYLLLASSLRRPNWMPGFALAAFLCGLAAMVKLSAAVAIAGGLVGAAALMFLRSAGLGVRAVAVLGVTAPLSFAGLYWLHNPSWTGLCGYVWGLGEVSGGYSTAMSSRGVPLMLAAGGAAELALCLALMLHERKNSKDNSLALMAVFLLPIAMSWKHMIVRLDVFHLPAFFSFAALVMGMLIAFRERPSRKPVADWAALVFGAVVIVFLTQPVMAYWSAPGSEFSTARRRVLSGAAALQHVSQAFDIERTQGELLWQSSAQLQGKLLPPGLRTTIGSETVGFFGSNYPFAVIDELDLRLAPVPQLYSVYTPALDQLCAEWVKEEAPEYLLMDWQAIDDRQPLTQAPRTWLAVWRWYETEQLEGSWLLLARRRSPRFGEPVAVGSSAARGAELVQAKYPAQPLLAAVHRPLSVTGHLAQTFFHVPPILVRYENSRGEAVEHRAILNVADYPTLMRPLPANLDEVAKLLAPASDGAISDRFEAFSFQGAEGYYVDEFEVEFFTLEIPPQTTTEPQADR